MKLASPLEGKAGAYFRGSHDIGESPEGTLEDIFAKAGIENGWLNLKPRNDSGKWLAEQIHSRPLGYGWMKAKWGEHFDAMVFNREMTPSTR